MSRAPSSHSRRALLAGGLAATALAARPAHAAARLTYPLGLLYGRIGPEGFERIDVEEQELWSGMGVRLAGLISRIEPVQQFSMLTNSPPPLDNDAGNILMARQIASELGLDHILLYASRDGRRHYPAYNNWPSRAFNSIRSRLSQRDEAIAEAHIIETAGGLPLISLSLDAPPRHPLNPFDLHRDPEEQALKRLARAIEASIQEDARAAFVAQRSIAD